MAETTTYQPTAEEAAIRLWLVDALAFTNETVSVIYQNQGKGRVAKPFVTLQVLSQNEVATPQKRVRDNGDGTGQLLLVENRAGVVQVTSYGSISWTLARAIERSLWIDSVLSSNRSRGIEITNTVSAILDVPELMSTDTEQRRVQDFRFAFCEQTDLGVVSVLESVAVTGTVEAPTSGGDLASEEFVVSWP